MKAIQPVHTNRISVALRQLTIGQVQELCEIPAQYDQRTVTEFLRKIIVPIERPAGEPAVTDPLMWSVNERMHVTTFYMAAMVEDGPNFSLAHLRLSDYLLSETDYVAEVPFEVEDEQLIFSQLHGYQAEAIEALIVTGRFKNTFLNWNAGYMAACVRGVDDEPVPYSHPAQYQEQLATRMENLLRMPESKAADFYEAFLGAATAGQHFLHAIVNEHGILAQQVTDPVCLEGSEVPVIGTARFRPRTAISSRALDLVAPAYGAEE